jgi:hypothetical protein
MFRVVSALILLALVTGCNHVYHANFVEAYRAGQYQVAETKVQSEGSDAINDKGSGDRMIYLLEQGAVERAAGHIEASNQAFESADLLFQKFDQKAQVRIGREVTAAVTNQTQFDYEGYGYDRLMTNCYKALNYLQQGNYDFARAELKRVAYAQQMIEMHKADRIAQMKKDKQESKDYNVDRAMHDPRFRAESASLYTPLNNSRAVYVNAFAEYLQGIYYLQCGDFPDLEVARAALTSAASMCDNEYVRQDLQLIDRITQTGKREPITYVIFETGLAPRREQIRIDIPIWIVNIAAYDTGVDYVGAAFPKLVPEPGGLPYLRASSSSGQFTTQTIVDMDAVVSREFKDDLPAIITRTLISTGTKATLAYAANRATRGNDIANVLTRIGTTAYQYWQNDADLRTWRTLPKMIVVARFPTPADGNLTLTAPGGYPVAQVRVQPNKSNLVWVRSPADNAVPAVQSCVLQSR